MPVDDRVLSDLKEVIIHTDGAAVPNPGTGGFGVVLRYGSNLKELSGGFRLTTNNRMELMAVIVGLEALKECCRVTLYSDSRYIVDSIGSGAAFRWKVNGWTFTPTGSKPVKNRDLWERLLNALERHAVEFQWVKGHAGNAENERCDVLATLASQQPGLPDDPGYQPPAFLPTAGGDPAGPRPDSSEKIVVEGQPCRNCGTPVVKRLRGNKKIKPRQTYYFEWFLCCPGCHRAFMVEAAKRIVSPDDPDSSSPESSTLF